LKFLRDPKFEIAFMIGVGTRNKSERAEAERIRDMITHTAQTRQKTVFQLYPGGLRGADLLSRKDVGAQDQVLEFLDEHLKKLPPNWRDRKSKLSADK